MAVLRWIPVVPEGPRCSCSRAVTPGVSTRDTYPSPRALSEYRRGTGRSCVVLNVRNLGERACREQELLAPKQQGEVLPSPQLCHESRVRRESRNLTSGARYRLGRKVCPGEREGTHSVRCLPIPFTARRCWDLGNF